MKLFLEVINIIATFIITLVFCMILWFIPGPNAVYKRDVVTHKAAHWEVTPSGDTIFVWNQ